MNKTLGLIENLTSQKVSIRLIFLVLIEWSWVRLILFKPYFLASNIFSLDSKQNHKIIESLDEKIKSMTKKRFEIEVREKEETIHGKVFEALYERRIGDKVLISHFFLFNCLLIVYNF